MTERKAEAAAKQEMIKTKQREAESNFKNIALTGGRGGPLENHRAMQPS